MVPPPSSASCRRKLSAPRLGSSKRSTRLTMPRKCRATRATVTVRASSGYSSGSSAMSPTLAVLPLSPERACASHRSCTSTTPFSPLTPHLSRRQDLHPHPRLDLPPVHQRGPVCHDLLHLGPAPGEPGHAGRAGQHERGQLAGEPLHRRFLPRPHADPELDLGRVGIGRTREPAVGGVGAHELGQDLLEL